MLALLLLTVVVVVVVTALVHFSPAANIPPLQLDSPSPLVPSLWSRDNHHTHRVWCEERNGPVLPNHTIMSGHASVLRLWSTSPPRMFIQRPPPMQSWAFKVCTDQDPQPLTLSQTVTTPTITNNAARPILNTVDAHAYLDFVENSFRERPEVYTQFVDIMEEFDKT